jgi:hypothetical protein
VLLLAGSGRVSAQTEPRVNEQDELDFGRLSLAVGSGARALGMGGAFLARADDATAASWNPAGLSYLRLPEVSLVGISYDLDSTRRAEDTSLLRLEHTGGRLPDFVSVAVPLSLGATSGAVQLSFQRVIPYTGHRRIDDLLRDSPRTFEIDASGGFDVLALSTGLKLAPWLRTGVSVNRWTNGFTQHRERLVFRGRSLQDADFRIAGWSVNAGLILHPHETVNVGLVAKTKMSGTVELLRTRTDFFPPATGTADVITHNAYRSDAVRLDLPAAIGFGASWRASSVFTVSSDYTVTFWSRSRIRNYFTLSATQDSFGPPPAATVYANLPFPNVTGSTQSDTRELRVGIEYVLIAGSLKLPLRAGYVREKQYRVQPDGTAPRLDGVTGGAGLILGRVLLDAAYVYQWGGFGPPEARDTLRLHRALLSLIYRHGSGS